MIRLPNDLHAQTVAMLDEMTDAANPLLWLEDRGIWTRGDVARASGISAQALKLFADGKRPSKAQMAALKFAALQRLMGL